MLPKLVWLVTVFLLAFTNLGEAQEQPKLPRIGWLGSGGFGGARESFRREFSKLGYVDGKNIVFETRYAENKLDRLPALANELVRLKVDVLVATSSNAALAAKNATSTIPIVYVSSGDPVALGLVDSLARPGGNITGFTAIAAVLAGKQLELVKETIPKLSRIAVLWDPQNPGNAQTWKESQFAARELALQVHSTEVSSADKYETGFKEAVKTRSSALVVTNNPLTSRNRKHVVDLAEKYRLPAIYPREDYVTSGGLMSYGADRAEPYRRAALYVDKILKGARPADLPVEQPTKFELVINFKTAKALGLIIPASVLARTDKVIK